MRERVSTEERNTWGLTGTRTRVLAVVVIVVAEGRFGHTRVLCGFSFSCLCSGRIASNGVKERP